MRPWRCHRHSFLLTLQLLLTVFVLRLAPVSGLMDGGDFVTVTEEDTPEPGQNDHHGTCPNPNVNNKETFLSIFNSQFCPHDEVIIQEEPVKVESGQQNMGKRLETEYELSKNTDHKLPETKEAPIIPLIIKAVPVSAEKPKDEHKAEAETQTDQVKESDSVTPVPPAEKPDLGRKESSVEEEAIESETEVPPGEAGGEAVIAPFSQWAERKLEEQAALKDATKKEQQEPEAELNGKTVTKPAASVHNVKANGGHKMNKNFASPDCSAKIIGANPDSQGSGNVISFSKDEYFLNKCTDKAWFVVELCESIKAVKVQIANFELYSSSPHEFKVSIGSVFPAREKDWIEFGTFKYEDERSMQTFKNDVGVVGKYAKVEILSHHGSEHYCPVSLFKVFGIPEIDLITEEEDPEDVETDVDEAGEDEPKSHPIMQTIKDAVVKVVNVFRPQNVSSLVETLNTSSLEGASLRFRLKPEAGDKYDQDVINRYHMIYYLLATQYTKVKQYSRILDMHRSLPCLCGEFGLSFGDPGLCNSSSHPWQFIRFVRAYHGEDFMVALCNLESMESGESRLVERGHVLISEALHNNTLSLAVGENGTVKNVGVDQQSNPVVEEEEKSKVDPAPRKPEETVVTKETGKETTQQHPEASAGSGTVKEEPQRPSVLEAVIKTPGAASSQAAAQTTWQKLSNRIKALERNVTLSTGFLEELSRKYIKQIEDLNNAVKIASEAIAGIQKREELSNARTERLIQQVEKLSRDMGGLEASLGLLQDEILARHGLLILGEVLFIGLVFLLCRPDGMRKVDRLSSVALQDNRRRSLDTMRDEREKRVQNQELEKRRSSIEVGCLSNGSLVQNIDSLTKKQRKRRRRKDSKQTPQHLAGLRHVQEELESDYSNPQEPGGLGGVSGVVCGGLRTRVDSWADTREGLSMEASGGGDFEPGFSRYNGINNGEAESMQSTPRKAESQPRDRNHNGWKLKDSGVKTVRFPTNSNIRKVGSGHNPHHMGPSSLHPEISNIYTMLDNSSACDTESDDRRGGSRPNLRIIRSKSSSPNRQENLLRKQREAIRKFQPDQAEWLQQQKNDFQK